MAQRRMFNRAITESDAFVDMPLSAQALYFHLGMETDDDGFVVSPKRIQRALGAADEDMRQLVDGGFVIPFETGPLVITHHKANNTLRNDRYKPTLCMEERSRLESLSSGAYALMGRSASGLEVAEPHGIPSGNQAETDGTPNITEHNPAEPANSQLSCKPDPSSIVAEIVGYLNQRIGRNFKATTKATARHIGARIAEGYTLEDFQHVIDNKAGQWENDPNMSRYLRPETLFGPKFEAYLNEAPAKEVDNFGKYED